MQQQLIALIPAYRPDGGLLALLEQLRQAGFAAVVVDDGSGEAYAPLFLQAARYAAVLTHPLNCGKGRALKTGLAHIAAQYDGDYTVVTLDADGQHTIADALRVCREAAAHPEALVLGSRGFEENVPLRSRFGNTATRWVYRLATGVPVRDTQTGLRAFCAPLLPAMQAIAGERYEYEMNVLLACSRGRVPIREVGIETVYLNNNAASHFHVLRDSYRVYKEILKFSASSLFCFAVDYGLYSLLLFYTAGWGVTARLRFANVTARLVSAALNYLLNRRLVFRSRCGVSRSAAQYAALAAAILLGNTMLLRLLVQQFGVQQHVAKLLTELTFFAFSWFVQRKIIFRQRQKERITEN